MQILGWNELGRAGTKGAVVAIGNFDGVHRGHAALIAEARGAAERIGAPLAAAVFDPHPRRYFQPDSPTFLLTSLETKAELLGELGCAFVFVLPFDVEMAARSASAFVEEVIDGELAARAVAVGSEFRFGHDREGDAARLAELCAGRDVETIICDALARSTGDEKFSSSSVRFALQNGNPKGAAQILGRPWAVKCVVQRGDQRGRTIGFPTANMTLGDLLEPKRGVYAVRIRLGEGLWRAGVANFGRRPTVGGATALLETHVFDFAEEIYGEMATVEFIEFIRDERKFDGLDALKSQIETDCARARELLSA